MRPTPPRLSILLFSLFVISLISRGAAGEPGRAQIGKELVEKHDCRKCHNFFSRGGDLAPELSTVGLRRSAGWLMQWLDEPTELLPGTDMEYIEWDDPEQDRADVVAFLLSLTPAVDWKRIDAERDPRKRGERLVRAYDCRACHRIVDGGMERFPDLTHIGSKVQRRWLTRFLSKPQAYSVYEWHPAYPFGQADITAVASYLSGLK